MKVVHLSSVHSRYDTRIFLKECRSLALGGYTVSLVVADGKGNEKRDQVAIYDVGASKGRLDRIWNVTSRVFDQAKKLDADMYHLHDPELIPVGLKLKKLGKKVVFDAHEDVPKQLLGKPYLHRSIRWILSGVFGAFERWACSHLDGIVTATPYIRDKFLRINSNSIDINNFPMLGELGSETIDWSTKKNYVCYVGNIARIRGVLEVVHAIGHCRTNVRLQLGGGFAEPSLEQVLSREEGWQNVDALGFLDRAEVKDVLQHSVAGLVTFHPAPNHIDAQPNKMFEYMSAGVPVIGSDFPLWKEIIEGNDCGLCVDPLDPKAISSAIDTLMSNPGRAQKMGVNGQRAVHTRYNWNVEEQKLLHFYQELSSA